jgi:hypothetical protein
MATIFFFCRESPWMVLLALPRNHDYDGKLENHDALIVSKIYRIKAA